LQRERGREVSLVRVSICARKRKGEAAMNTVLLSGRVVSHPELIKPDRGKTVCNLLLETVDGYWHRDLGWQAKFERHRIAFWDGLSRRVSTSLKEGDEIFVEGRLHVRANLVEVVASRFLILDGKREDGGDTESSAKQQAVQIKT
jgi:single-stranded DNA-binding protein